MTWLTSLLVFHTTVYASRQDGYVATPHITRDVEEMEVRQHVHVHVHVRLRVYVCMCMCACCVTHM